MPHLYLLADLHLSRDMAEFGAHWEGHEEKLRAGWDATVGADDVVAVPGDISFARKLPEVMPDLQWLADRPGRKVLVKGNHDWWWTSTAKVRAALPPGIKALDGDATVSGGFVLCGAKGYLAPEDSFFVAERDVRPYRRALDRVQRALDAIAALREEQENASRPAVLLLHYPPITSEGHPTAFSEMLADTTAVDWVCYGHFHSAPEWRRTEAYIASQNGTQRFQQALGSADYLGFQPRLIL